MVGIDEVKIIFDKGEIVRNGAALHIDLGIALTNHASQAKTIDQVIVSVPVRAFSRTNEAQFYVSMSRARSGMHVFTDSKVALRDAVTRPSKRLSSWELPDRAEKDRALKAELNKLSLQKLENPPVTQDSYTRHRDLDLDPNWSHRSALLEDIFRFRFEKLWRSRSGVGGPPPL